MERASAIAAWGARRARSRSSPTRRRCGTSSRSCAPRKRRSVPVARRTRRAKMRSRNCGGMGTCKQMTKDVTAQEFEEQVLRESRTVLVDFYTENCGPCKMLTPTLNELATENAERLKVAKIDVSANAELAARF